MRKILTPAVVVSALGYFVDIYDLILFSIVRVPSLRSLGVPENELLLRGVELLNAQMFGMLLGGVFWGVLGDKKGRISVLFGSILLYSVANLLNGAVTSIQQYYWLRIIAGIGLAGELGAGITLVVESLPQNLRGYGTTIVASFGICGAILAAQIADHFDWRTAYIIGGVLGLALLVLRVSVYESNLYQRITSQPLQRGTLSSFLKTAPIRKKYLYCVLIGIPIWFVIGNLVTFAPEYAQAHGITGVVSAGTAVMYCYIGLAIGDLFTGLLSQRLQSRKKVVFLFLGFCTLGSLGYLYLPYENPDKVYLFSALLGFAAGYWALFVTIASEQFGTNIRATATTSIPNFVRGSVIPVSLLFQFLNRHTEMRNASAITGAITLSIALYATTKLEETFSKNLDYVE